MKQIADLRATYVDKLDDLRAQLDETRTQLPQAQAAARAAKEDYDTLYRFVMAPLHKENGNALPEIPSATSAWLIDAKQPVDQARSALVAVQRRIQHLETDISKWRGEIEFLDVVLSQNGKVQQIRPTVVKPPQARTIEFDDITMPAVGRN